MWRPFQDFSKCQPPIQLLIIRSVCRTYTCKPLGTCDVWLTDRAPQGMLEGIATDGTIARTNSTIRYRCRCRQYWHQSINSIKIGPSEIGVKKEPQQPTGGRLGCHWIRWERHGCCEFMHEYELEKMREKKEITLSTHVCIVPSISSCPHAPSGS